MDWNKVVEFLWPILSPIIQFGLSALTGYVLALLAALIKEKLGVTITDVQLKAAKEAVLQAEEMAITAIKKGLPKMTSGDKKAMAVALLTNAKPKLTGDKAEKLVNTAVAVLPDVGATADSEWKIFSDPSELKG